MDILVDPSATALERFAAQEMAAQLQRVLEVETHVGTAPSTATAQRILLGMPAQHPEIRALGVEWPELTAQGHLLRTVEQDGDRVLVVGGGSPVAVLWAAYELGHQLGIRYFLFGDLDPVERPGWPLQDLDLVLEPRLEQRAWRTVNDFPIGPESWGLEEHQRVLRQLAKLKYNRVVLSVYPWQPFVHFEHAGTAKQTAMLWYGWQFPLDGEIAGRAALTGLRQFTNPDFAAAQTYDERIVAGHRLLQGIIDTAHELGMTAGLLTSPLEFPKEFSAALPQARTVNQPGHLTIGPGAAQKPDDPQLLALCRAQLDAYRRTYPKLDAIYLSLPEFPEWEQHAAESWEHLAARAGPGVLPPLDQLVATASNRSLTASGARGASAVRGNLAVLDFLYHLVDGQLAGDPSSEHAQQLHIVQVDPALFPVLDKLLPPDAHALHFIDYTARRVATHRDLLAQVPTHAVPSSLILTLGDDNVGVLPQLASGALETLLPQLDQQRWQGFMTRYWCIGDLDLSAYMLSRGSFEPVTAERALEQLIGPTCGSGTVEPVGKAFAAIERATVTIDQHDLGFSFPVPGMLMKHYAAEGEPPAWWSEVRDGYLEAMNEMYRANTRARRGGRAFTLYWARRSEFGFEYMNCVEALRRAGIAKRAQDGAARIEHLTTAVESLHAALTALAAVARSNSDRGIIVTLNEFGYRPLLAELAAAEDEAAP